VRARWCCAPGPARVAGIDQEVGEEVDGVGVAVLVGECAGLFEARGPEGDDRIGAGLEELEEDGVVELFGEECGEGDQEVDVGLGFGGVTADVGREVLPGREVAEDEVVVGAGEIEEQHWIVGVLVEEAEEFLLGKLCGRAPRTKLGCDLAEPVEEPHLWHWHLARVNGLRQPTRAGCPCHR
jgi:hypothetical protein